MIPCANFMNLKAIQETVREYDEMWGAPGEPPAVITLERMINNCSMCDFGIRKISQLTETVMTAAGIPKKEARAVAKRQVDSMGSTKTMRGECPLGAKNPLACLFCTRGHMTECHYPLTCESARCGHYLAELAAEGANDFPDSWEDLQHDLQMAPAMPKKNRNHPTRGARALAYILSPFHIMVRQCGWCNKLLGFRRHGTGVTTGMCEACHKKEVEGDNGGSDRESRPG